MKKGFTLVELSIVLVIIGLLIGGILVAQSMISTAKIVGVAGQLQQFEAGTMAFKAKYQALPGDSKLFGGDEDGVIERTAASTYDNAVTIFMCEIANYWNNMNPDLFPASSTCNGGSLGVKVVTSGVNKNAPASKLGAANSFFIASAITDGGFGYADTANPRNYYAILNGTQGQIPDGGGQYVFYITNATNSAVKPIDALALDKKIDDGNPDLGIVISGRIGPFNSTDGGISAGPATGLCSATGTYTVSDSRNVCTPLIRIGGIAGDVQ